MTTLRKLVEDEVANAALGFQEVKGAADLKTILAGRVSTPGCYVYREQTTTRPNTTATRVLNQPRTEYIALLVTTRNVADARGGINADENEEYCDLIESALLGFVPDERYSPMEHGGGKLVLLANGFHYWREIYYSTRFIRT